MTLINIDQITHIECFTSANSLSGDSFIYIYFTNGSSRMIIFESDIELHTTVNKIVVNSGYKINFVSGLFSQSN